MSGSAPGLPTAGEPAADIPDHLREIAAILAAQGFHAAAANVRRAIAEIGRLRSMPDAGDGRLRDLLLAADVPAEEAVRRLHALRATAAPAGVPDPGGPGGTASTVR